MTPRRTFVWARAEKDNTENRMRLTYGRHFFNVGICSKIRQCVRRSCFRMFILLTFAALWQMTIKNYRQLFLIVRNTGSYFLPARSTTDSVQCMITASMEAN